MLPIAIAIRHVAFEGLGIIETSLREAGYTPHVYDACVDDLWTIEPVKTDLVILLGGPIGAYGDDRYPFLAEELRILEARLAADLERQSPGILRRIADSMGMADEFARWEASHAA